MTNTSGDKYTPRGGSVRLALRSTATQAVFEVIDSGIGITPEDLPRVFDRFYRASNARYVNSDGSGLGLAIAQWIANAHDGTLEALSLSGESTQADVQSQPKMTSFIIAYGKGLVGRFQIAGDLVVAMKISIYATLELCDQRSQRSRPLVGGEDRTLASP